VPITADGRASRIGTPDEAHVLARHRWYVVKESFSPRLVEIALSTATSSQRVLDPFAGGGTVPLVAATSGRVAVGLEVNPFLADVSRAKLCDCKPDRLLRVMEDVAQSFIGSAKSPLIGYSTFSRASDESRGLFSESVLNAFEAGWVNVHARRGSARSLLRLALVGAAMDNCYAVKDGKALRYRASRAEQTMDASTFEASFRRRISDMAADLAEAPASGWHATIKSGDSRRLLSYKDSAFDLCITSPPYLNSFDYSDVYRPELFLTSAVRTTAELRQIRLRTIRSHVQVSWTSPSGASFGQLYDHVVKSVDERIELLWDRRIPDMIRGYFEDMDRVLKLLHDRASETAELWLVVSTSAYAGIHIPVDELIGQIGEQRGWHLNDFIELRRLRSSAQHWKQDGGAAMPLRESLVRLTIGPRSQAIPGETQRVLSEDERNWVEAARKSQADVGRITTESSYPP
jgi:hypothetical protein